MTQNTSPQFDSLRTIYADVISNMKQDPIEQLLVLTYEFDDQQLLNLVSARPLEEDFELRRNHLKLIADLKPVVFYDARKTRAFNQLPHFLELVAVKTSTYSCHHSKAYLIVTQNTVRLVLGSFNLTYTGLFSNREVFEEFVWSKEATDDINVLHDFISMLRRQYADHPQVVQSDAVAALLTLLDGRLAAWGRSDKPSRYTLIASGPPASGLSQLATLWQTISSTGPRRIFAVSPFFDQGQARLVDMLAEALGAPEQIQLVTDATCIAALSQRHYGTQTGARTLHLIPSDILPQERHRIEQANVPQDLSALHIERKLHAKILLLEADGRYLIYIGSANFTCKAWNGDNHELGIAWIENGSAQGRIRAILQGLSVRTDNVYDQLPVDLPGIAAEDDEGYEDVTGYPDFIERIVLQRGVADDELHFAVTPVAHPAWGEYEIRWGTLPILLQGGRSQTLKVSEFYTRLVGGKNLEFVSKSAPDRTFWMPFWHAPDLLRQQDTFLFSSSEDWLQFYLGLGRQDVHLPGESLPGEIPVAEVPADLIEIDRDANLVIQMQRYLTLFAGVEKLFTERARTCAALTSAQERAAAIQQQLVEPLMTYATILKKEFERASDREQANLVFGFKLGELVLFCRSLTALASQLRPIVSALTSMMECTTQSRNTALATYMDYCNEVF